MYNCIKTSDNINLHYESKIIKLKEGESLINYDIAKLENSRSFQKNGDIILCDGNYVGATSHAAKEANQAFAIFIAAEGGFLNLKNSHVVLINPTCCFLIFAYRHL